MSKLIRQIRNSSSLMYLCIAISSLALLSTLSYRHHIYTTLHVVSRIVMKCYKYNSYYETMFSSNIMMTSKEVCK